MWQNSGICSVGDGCKFAHEAIEETTDFETTFAARMAAQSSTEDVLMESAAGTPTELPSPVMKDQGKDDESLEWYDEDGPKQCLTHGYISDGSQDSDVGFIHKSYSGRRMVSLMTTTMLKHHDSDDSIMHSLIKRGHWCSDTWTSAGKRL